MVAQIGFGADLISPETMVPQLLTRWPSTRAVLDRYGLSGCGGRLGPVESIRFFARAHGVPEERLLHELKEAAQQPASEAAAPAACSLADAIYRRFFVAGIVLVLTAGFVEQLGDPEVARVGNAEIELGPGVEPSALSGQLLGVPHVVRVQEGHEIAGRQAQSQVSRG